MSTRLRTIIFSGFQGTTDSIFFIAGPGSKIDQDGVLDSSGRGAFGLADVGR